MLRAQTSIGIAAVFTEPLASEHLFVERELVEVVEHSWSPVFNHTILARST